MEAEYVERGSERFPERLLGVKPPIHGLWYRGSYAPQLFSKTVAMVGSRKMSRYGKQVLADIVPRYVAAGYTTISGFMYGIDIEMHRLTVENDGKTIGVFGWGIDYKIIPENVSLYHKVIDSGGLFISEMKPNDMGTLWSFPARNRIVVGLADHVVVVEAGRRSGSLNSAKWARQLGVPVYAVPGAIFSPTSEGTNWLIDEGYAESLTVAKLDELLGEPRDENYSKKGRNNQVKATLDENESTVVTLLTLEGPQMVNEISRRLREPPGEVMATLTMLAIRGVVTEERGVWRVN